MKPTIQDYFTFFKLYGIEAWYEVLGYLYLKYPKKYSVIPTEDIGIVGKDTISTSMYNLIKPEFEKIVLSDVKTKAKFLFPVYFDRGAYDTMSKFPYTIYVFTNDYYGNKYITDGLSSKTKAVVEKIHNLPYSNFTKGTSVLVMGKGIITRKDNVQIPKEIEDLRNQLDTFVDSEVVYKNLGETYF